MNRYKYIRKYERVIRKLRKYDSIKDRILSQCMHKKVKQFELEYPDCVAHKIISVDNDMDDDDDCNYFKFRNVVGMITNGIIDIAFDIDYYRKGLFSINKLKYYNNITSNEIHSLNSEEISISNEINSKENRLFKEHFLYGGEIKPPKQGEEVL